MDCPVDVTGVEINTDRLVLRPIAMMDWEDMYAYASVPGVGEMAGWKHHESPEETKCILQALTDSKNILAIVHKADQKMIGTVGLHSSWASGEDAYRSYKVREIGYVLSKAYWGQGLMPEAVRAVIDYSFDNFGVEVLTCGHFAENSQSRRVIEKCGFTFVKQGKYAAEQLQKTFDEMQYILLKTPPAGDASQ